MRLPPCCKRGCPDDAIEALVITRKYDEIEELVCRKHSASERARYPDAKIQLIPLTGFLPEDSPN